MNPILHPLGRKRRGLSLLSTLLVLLAVLFALYYFRGHLGGRMRHGGDGPASEQGFPDLKPLEGEWLRPESGAVLEISGVDRPGPVSIWTSGTGNASISGASVRVADGLLTVEMDYSDDAGPDCSCRLTYDETGDRLVGDCLTGGGERRPMVLVRRR